MKKLILVVLFLVILTLFIGSAPAAKEMNKHFHETFEVQKGDVLHLTHGDGDVMVVPWNKDMIDVEVHFRADVERVGIGQEYHFDVDFSQRGNSVYVTEKERSGFTIGFSSFKTYEYIYEIKAPEYIRLDLIGDDGDVDVQGWKQEIECRIDDGDVFLKNIQANRIRIWGEDGTVEIEDLKADLSISIDDGDIYLLRCDMPECRVEMEDGDTRIQKSSGSFDITSDDGDVIFYQTRADKLYIRANDGDIDLDLLKSDTLDADIKTDDGPVKMNLERGFSTSFYAYSDDGRIRIELENIDRFEDERHAKSGEINGGRGRIRIRTSDGNITMGEK
ncbi:MAG: DUF4097 family beta strand repeat protein [Candidatus Aminicenantes bacterium]|nr:DUF4097 family beta strand repeat protein [Candidatus Aminicenantes bacterium]